MSIRIAVVSLSCGAFINQISYSCRLFAMVTTNGIDIAHAEPDGVERGKEGKRQYRANGSASDQDISHGSPEHGMRERNKCEDCGQCGQNDWSRPLDGGLDNRMIWIKTICLIGMNLTDQNECIPHQDTRQTNQTENGVKSKRLMENQQRWNGTEQSERAGQHHHPHSGERAHLNDDNSQHEQE